MVSLLLLEAKSVKQTNKNPQQNKNTWKPKLKQQNDQKNQT